METALQAEPSSPSIKVQIIRPLSWAWRLLVFLWKFVAGVFLSQAFLGSIVVAGWTARLSQRAVRKQWWRRSEHPERGSDFSAFAAAHSATAQSARWPNWILAENARAHFARRTASSILKALLVALGQNIRVGAQIIFTTWTVTMPGCALMLFAWYAGWLNSFNKGYEQAIIGPATGVAGIGLFIAAMCYVPLAQIRQASTGSWRSFYDFQFVRALIRERFVSCFLLACAYSLFFVPVTVAKIAPAFIMADRPDYATMSNAEALSLLQNYFFGVTFILLPLYIALRIIAAKIYASAVLGALKRGSIHEDALADNEWEILNRLDLLTVNLVRMQPAWLRATTWVASRATRVALGVAVLLVWFTFIAQAYVSEFFLKSARGQGWLNQPLVQLPWFSYIPPRLTDKDPDN